MADGDLALDAHQNNLRSDIPSYYVNGFSMGLSNADFNMVLIKNGAPQASVNISYTTLKTLAINLLQAVQQLEEATGREIMTVDVVSEKLNLQNNVMP